MNSWEITVSYEYFGLDGTHTSTGIYVGGTDIDAINDMLDFYSSTDRRVLKIDEIYEWEGV